MCRNIRTLFNFKPTATDKEIKDASLQFVRKISGFTKPSHVNEKAFNKAVNDVFITTRKLVDSLETTAPKKNREVEAQKRKELAKKRFG